MMISVNRKIPDRSLDANTRNTTAVKMVLQFYKCVNPRLRIMVPDGLIIPKMYYITLNFFCKKIIYQ